MTTWDEVLAAETAAAAPPPGWEDGRLVKEWVVPPFTVLDSSQGYWKERRRRWLALGIESELGRGMAAKPDKATNVDRLATLPDQPAWQDHPAYRGRGGALDVSQQVLTAKQMDTHASARRTALRRTESIYASGEATGYATHASSRREADTHSNLTGAAELPDYADFGTTLVAPGTSIFDPVLAECAIRWWCPPGGTVLDPFAGGSVRGIVAAMLGHAYTGVDLSQAQVEANREQAQRILPPDRPQPRWFVGDSREVLPDLPAGLLFDMVLTCPPYYDLEVYSEDPADLSAMPTYAAFTEAYGAIISSAVARLHSGRLAAIVVSDVRGRDGTYIGLRRDTELLFLAAGARLYNDAVLINAVGTLAMRAMRQMQSGRKLGRMHQNVLVFSKGTISTRDWDHVRAAPPEPQQALGLVPDAPEVVQPALLAVPSEIEADLAAEADTAQTYDEAVAALYDVPAEMLGGADQVGMVQQQAAIEAPQPAVEAEVAADATVAATTAVAPPLRPVPGPAPISTQLAIRPSAGAPPALCGTCGELLEARHEVHAPYTTPEEAAGLFAAGVWQPEDATEADAEAMRQAGLWGAD